MIFVVSLTFIAKVRTKIQVSNHEHLGDDQDEAKVASRIILAERILVVYGRLEFEFCSIVTRSRVRRSLSYVYTSKSYSGALANVYMRSPEKIGYLFPQEDTSWIKYERFVGGLVRGRWICFHDQCFSTCARFSTDSTRYLPFVFRIRIALVYLSRIETEDFYISLAYYERWQKS